LLAPVQRRLRARRIAVCHYKWHHTIYHYRIVVEELYERLEMADAEEAGARQKRLAEQLENEKRKAKRTAVQLGLLTQVVYVGSLTFGGIATALGLLGSKRLGVPDGTLEPWISLCAAISTGGAFLLRSARLRTRTAIWFDFTSFLETLLFRLNFRLPAPPTFEAIAAVSEAFEIERMKVQQRMRDADDEAEAPRLGNASPNPPRGQ
jgi:hypothetical protein